MIASIARMSAAVQRRIMAGSACASYSGVERFRSDRHRLKSKLQVSSYHQFGGHVPDEIEQAKYELALANRIVAYEGVLDAFGHISMRHPLDSDRYLLARSRGPELVDPGDVLEFTMDSKPVSATAETGLYGERVIHSGIYKARPDVNAVCHHHSSAILPYCIADVPLVPVYHQGATMGFQVPVWDSRTEFGNTNLMVVTAEEGDSLARALGRIGWCSCAGMARLWSAPACGNACFERSIPTGMQSCNGSHNRWET